MKLIEFRLYYTSNIAPGNSTGSYLLCQLFKTQIIKPNLRPLHNLENLFFLVMQWSTLEKVKGNGGGEEPATML